MFNGNRHIISKVQWDLLFDHKEKVHDLQSKFGAWSREGFLREANELFSKLCPEDQTWRINQLTLDLGDLEYDLIEEELPQKLSEALYTSLLKLLIAADDGSEQMTVLDHVTTQLHLLQDYLENGYLPWSETGAISVNVLLETQLQSNHSAVLDMVRRSGTHLNVRKRIAWQFEDRIVRKLVRGLEPDQYLEIESFSEEFMKVQRKKQVVKTTTTDFRKNLWFWILNYLFDERGTLFNRVSFMEHSIREMAQHFNIKFHQLFEEIKLAVREIEKTQSIDSGFLIALNVLATRTEKKKLLAENGGQEISKKAKEIVRLLHGEQDVRREDVQGIFKELEWIDVEEALNSSEAGINWQKRLPLIVPFLSEEQREVWVPQLLSVEREAVGELWEVFTRILNVSEGRRPMVLKHLLSVSRHSKPKASLAKEVLQHYLNEVDKEEVIRVYDLFQNYGPETIYKGNKVAPDIILALESLTREAVITQEALSNREMMGWFFGHQWKNKRFNRKEMYQIQKRIQENELLFRRLFGRDYSSVVQVLSKNPYLFEIVRTVISKEVWEEKVVEVLKGENPLVAKTYEMILDWSIRGIFEIDDETWDTFEMTLIGAVCSAGGKIKEAELLSLLQIHLRSAVAKNENSTQLFTDLKTLFPKVSKHLFETSFFSSGFEKSFSKMTLNDFLELNKSSDYELIKYVFVNDLIKSQSVNELVKEVQSLTQVKQEQFVQLYFNSGKNVLKQFTADPVTFLRIELEEWDQKWSKTELKHYFFTILFSVRRLGRQMKHFKTELTALLKERGLILVPDAPHPKKREEIKPHKSEESSAQFQMSRYLSEWVDDQLSSVHQADLIVWIQKMLKENPKELQKWLGKSAKPEKVLALFSEVTSVQQFVVDYYRSDVKTGRALSEVCGLITVLIEQEGWMTERTWIEHKIWEVALTLPNTSSNPETIITDLLRDLIRLLILRKGLRAAQLSKLLVKYNKPLSDSFAQLITSFNKNLKNALKDRGQTKNSTPGFNEIARNWSTDPVKEKDWVEWIIQRQVLPVEWEMSPKVSIGDVYLYLSRERPFAYQTYLASIRSNTLHMEQFFNSVPLTAWSNALIYTNPNREKLIQDYVQLTQRVSKMKWNTFSTDLFNQFVMESLAEAWVTNDWNRLSANQFWKRISVEVARLTSNDQSHFWKEMTAFAYQFPIGIRLGLETVTKKREMNVERKKEMREKQERLAKHFPKEQEMLTESIAVTNAGIVLVSSYLKMLFDRLELLDGEVFKNENAQMKATQYTQYVVNGITQNEEHHLVLNKVLCGLHPNDPITAETTITDAEKELIDGMITAIIGYWPAIGDCSINGFRGNWLIREGLLSEVTDRWNLEVEKRAYDLLINQSPFSFGIIKYGWMKKPLHVHWAY